MRRRLILAFLVIAEIVLLVLLPAPMFHDSREKAALVYQLFVHPTDAAKAKLQRIHEKERVVESAFRAFALVCIVADGWGIIAVIRKMRACPRNASNLDEC